MWKKLKNILIIIGSAVLVFVLTIVYVLMCGSKVDRRGSDGADERDSAIKEGLGNAEESIRNSRDTADRCEEHLRRAEEILRNAIERGKEEKH